MLITKTIPLGYRKETSAAVETEGASAGIYFRQLL
jgi:hypothetical protein